MGAEDFDIDTLSTLEQRALAGAIVAWMVQNNPWDRPITGGGCRAFYSPDEWREQGNDIGHTAQLVLCHDGGDLAYLCNLDYDDYVQIEAFRQFLEARGLYVEPAESWWSAIYPIVEL